MGGDSRRAMNGSLVLQLPESAAKVFGFSGFAVGHTGVGRIRQLTARLNVRFGPRGPSGAFDLEDVLVELIIPQIKRRAREAGVLHEKEGITDLGGEVLVAFGHQMCLIGGDFTVTPIRDNFWAIGGGQRLALGSLATSERVHRGMRVTRRVQLALEVAARFDNTVAPPFTYVETLPIPYELA
jgi:hypothetical protein